jgi:ABC-type lipoprotein export system ATPase subunit
MIKLHNLDKYYSSKFMKTYVLRGIDLEVREGEFVTIMGPSGSGKSTLLHILGMLDEPSAGEYEFLGQPVHRYSERQRTELHKRYIGFIFQAYHLIDDLTVYENLNTPLLYQGLDGGERKHRLDEILNRFQLEPKKDLYPNQLSGGHQQLVGVARAIIARPKLLLADEPTGNLHSGQSNEIMEILKKLNEEGITIIQVTHSEANAAYSRRIIQLFDGKVARDAASLA